MVQITESIYGKWKEEDLKKAVAAVRNGQSVNSASKEYGIPRKTLEGHVKRVRSPRKMFGRPAMLSRDQENELVARILKLQSVGFGISKQKLQSMVYLYCRKNNIGSMFRNERAGKFWFQGFKARHPEIVLLKGESLSYGRLMRFNAQRVGEFYDLLGQVYDTSELSTSPQLIYNVDETGLQLTLRRRYWH